MKNYTPVYSYPLTEDDGWRRLTGELPVTMTNDYLFRALLQSDNDTLKALLASLLRISARDIRKAEITNHRSDETGSCNRRRQEIPAG